MHEVIEPGSKVLIDEHIRAVVVVVRLQRTGVDYHCEWWSLYSRDGSMAIGWSRITV